MLLMSRILCCVIFVILGWVSPAIPHALADVLDASHDVLEINKTHKDKCKIGLYINELYGFDYINHTFNADFWIWSVCASPQTLHRLENLYFVNSKEVEGKKVRTEEQVYRYRRILGRFRHFWDLQAFPFDEQNLQIMIEHGAESVNTLLYELDTEQSKMATLDYSDVWDVKKFSAQISSFTSSSTWGDPGKGRISEYNRMVFSFDIDRKSKAVFWRLTIGVFSAVMIMMMTFFVHPKVDALHNAQLTVMIGALFSVLMSYRNVGDYLGYTERLSLVDGIHIGGIIFILIAGCTVVIKRHLVCHRNRTIRHPDILGFATYVSAYVLFNVGVFVWATQMT